MFFICGWVFFFRLAYPHFITVAGREKFIHIAHDRHFIILDCWRSPATLVFVQDGMLVLHRIKIDCTSNSTVTLQYVMLSIKWACTCVKLELLKIIVSFTLHLI